MDNMRQSACLVVNPITVHSYGFLFNCMMVDLAPMEWSFSYKIVPLSHVWFITQCYSPKYSIIKGQHFTLDAADIDLGGLVSCIGPNKTPCFLIPV